MRPILALVLVALFSLQTAASAASPGQMPTANMQRLLSAIEGTQIFALLTGQGGRYEAMHAPALARAQKPPSMRCPILSFVICAWRGAIWRARQSPGDDAYDTTPVVVIARPMPQPIALPGEGEISGVGAFGTSGPILDAGREDGYFDGTVAIQGVRAFDPNMNQWTTPDAYSGDVHDPMSQHPYMWNGNNPVEYSDPTGYETVELFDNHFGIVLGHAAIFITSGKGDDGKLYCLCGSKGANPAEGPARILVQKTNLRSLTRGVGKGKAARYDTGIVFNTSPSEEKDIASYFVNDKKSGIDYNLANRNCVQECSRALHDAGVLTGGAQTNVVPNMDEGGGGESLHDIFEKMLHNQVPPQ
jgi:RHS repeat-associated protein